jgi:hypothetical protein
MGDNIAILMNLLLCWVMNYYYVVILREERPKDLPSDTIGDDAHIISFSPQQKNVP